jgi:hypothetical protein
VTGASGTGPGLSVIDTTPGTGAPTASPPPALVVRLSESVRADSVQREDLAVDGGASVTGVELVDGRTIRFLLQVPDIERTFAYTLAAGALLDLQGEASLAHHGSFSIEHAGPSVVAQVPAEQATFVLTQLTFIFDEALDPASFTAADVTRFSGPGGIDLRGLITEISGAGNTFIVSFFPQFALGTYVMTIGPDIRDAAGNLMDQDEDGLNGQAADTYTATVSLHDPLFVSGFGVTDSGFRAVFSRALDTGVLNLYGTAGDVVADVTVVGAASGVVRGSLLVGAGGHDITFLRTGGPLSPDTYTVTLRSAADGFRAPDGALLDGNLDGTPGDDYVFSFSLEPSALVVSAPDVARGPGQAVDVPATAVGLPVWLSDGAGVETVIVMLAYDPTLLTLTDAIPGPGLPVGSVVQAHLVGPGSVRISVSALTPFAPGATDLVTLIGHVPAAAPYGAMHILDIGEVLVNERRLPAVADDGLQLVAYFGDTTGNRRYTSLDAQRALRVAAGLDSGFAAFPRLDPVVLADTTADGTVGSPDGLSILQEVVGFDRVEIPPLPPPVGLAGSALLSLATTGLTRGALDPHDTVLPRLAPPSLRPLPSPPSAVPSGGSLVIAGPFEPTPAGVGMTAAPWVKPFVLELADELGANHDIRVLLPASISAEPVGTIAV